MIVRISIALAVLASGCSAVVEPDVDRLYDDNNDDSDTPMIPRPPRPVEDGMDPVMTPPDGGEDPPTVEGDASAPMDPPDAAPPPEPDPVEVYGACEANSQCAPGDRCETSDDPASVMPGDGPKICQTRCGTDADCPAYAGFDTQPVCRQGWCALSCNAASPCPPGWMCDEVFVDGLCQYFGR